MLLSRLSTRQLRLAGVLAATGLVVSCDTTAGFRPNEILWGFVTISAKKDGAGATRTSPDAVFFRGEVSTLPSATVKPDSCFPTRAYTPPTNSFTDVTYLDAGANVSLTMGGVANDLPRVSSGGVTTYKLASGASVAYQPGDSVVIRVPGANGGYPTTEVRAKTAEAFTLQPVVAPTSGFMQVRWTPATDGNSAILISLQYAPAGGTGAISQEITCAFVDDGADSISVAEYTPWAATTNLQRTVVANRLRTVLQNISGGAFQFISTYTVPTPTP